MAKAVLNSGESMVPGERLVSPNRCHFLGMQGDGNLVLYSLGKPIWATGTDGKSVKNVVMQGDGNLVLYGTDGKDLWNSGTANKGESFLQVQDDRNVVVYRKSSGEVKPTWWTHTEMNPDLWKPVQIEMSPETRAKLMADPAITPIAGTEAAIIVCSTPPHGPLICIGAMIAIALILELTQAKPAFGPGNTIRVVGGQISEEAKNAARGIKESWDHLGDVISKIPVPNWLPKWIDK